MNYSFSTFSAWGLTFSVGLMTIFGVYAAFLDPTDGWATFLHGGIVTSFAMATVFALFLANCSASHAQAMYEATGPKSAAFIFAVICAIGFCAASVIGVHLGYGNLAAQAVNKDLLPDKGIVTLGALFLAFAKPAMSWVVEARKSADTKAYEVTRTKRRQEMGLDLPPQSAPVQEATTAVPVTAAGPRLILTEPKERERVSGSRAVMGALLMATTGGTVVASNSNEPAPAIVVEHLVDQIQFDAVNTDAFRWVVSLRVAGATNTQIMAETNLPRTTVHRWLSVIDRAISDVKASRAVA